MTDPQIQPGCLGNIMAKLGIPIPGESASGNATSEAPIRLRDDFLSDAELSFLGVLRPLLGAGELVCPKVRLADLVFVLPSEEKTSHQNKIRQRHVDFVIYDLDARRAVAAIELDDASHRRSKRQEKDAYLDAALQAAGLPLLREPARYSYDTETLRARLATIRAEQPSEGGSVQRASSEGEPPECPRCGVAMTLRTSKKGPQAGKRFWGCPNYPQCRERVELTD